MDKRKELILKTIIKEYIKTAVPIGSEGLVEKYNLDVSSATVRNEMADLEEAGYIAQPHTSAGRIPTEKAYNFYLENLSEKKLSDSEIKIFKEALIKKEETDFKQAAKIMAKLSQIARALKKPKFSSRLVRRCFRCGRKRAFTTASPC